MHTTNPTPFTAPETIDDLYAAQAVEAKRKAAALAAKATAKLEAAKVREAKAKAKIAAAKAATVHRQKALAKAIKQAQRDTPYQDPFGQNHVRIVTTKAFFAAEKATKLEAKHEAAQARADKRTPAQRRILELQRQRVQDEKEAQYLFRLHAKQNLIDDTKRHNRNVEKWCIQNNIDTSHPNMEDVWVLAHNVHMTLEVGENPADHRDAKQLAVWIAEIQRSNDPTHVHHPISAPILNPKWYSVTKW
jgi:hypothetical protein